MERRTIAPRLKGPLVVSGSLLLAGFGAAELRKALVAGVILTRYGREVARAADPARYWFYFWGLSVGTLIFAVMAFLGLLALLMPDKRGGRLDRRLRERLEHPEPYVERLDD